MRCADIPGHGNRARQDGRSVAVAGRAVERAAWNQMAKCPPILVYEPDGIGVGRKSWERRAGIDAVAGNQWVRMELTDLSLLRRLGKLGPDEAGEPLKLRGRPRGERVRVDDLRRRDPDPKDQEGVGLGPQEDVGADPVRGIVRVAFKANVVRRSMPCSGKGFGNALVVNLRCDVCDRFGEAVAVFVHGHRTLASA